MKTEGLLKIIIIILLVVFIPVGLIVGLLAAMGEMFKILSYAIIAIAVVATPIAIYGYSASKKIEKQEAYPRLKEMGFDPNIAIAYYNACKKVGIKELRDLNTEKGKNDAFYIARNNPQFNFATEHDIYINMFKAVVMVNQEVLEIQRKKIRSSGNKNFYHKIEQKGYDPYLAHNFWRACVQKGVTEILTEFDRKKAIEIAKSNLEYAFAVKDDYFIELFNAAKDALTEIDPNGMQRLIKNKRK